MAIKSVSIDSVLTPALKVSQAEEMLGKVVQAPKTRWQPGSLSGSALGIVSTPCLAIVGASFVLVTESGPNVLADLLTDLSAVSYMLDATAAPGSSRSRVLVPDPAYGSVVPASFNSLQGNPELGSLLCLGQPPSLSATQILNLIDSFFQDGEVIQDYTALLDQETGRVIVFAGPYLLAKNDITASLATAGVPIVAAFSLTEPMIEEPVDGGPIWG